MIDGSCSAMSISSAMNASRIGGLPFARQAEFGARVAIFVALRRAIMPEHLVLHEGNALAFRRVADDHARLPAPARGHVEPIDQRVMVVPVDLGHMPAERAPLVGEGLDRKSVV